MTRSIGCRQAFLIAPPRVSVTFHSILLRLRWRRGGRAHLVPAPSCAWLRLKCWVQLIFIQFI